MPSLVIPNTFSANTTALSADVNANFSAVATFLNSTKLDNNNIQTGGIATANFAAGAVDTAALGAASVSGAKLATGAADATTLEVAGGSMRIKDSGVSTAKLADAGVTQAKLAARATGTTVAAGGIGISTSSGAFSTSATSFTDVTNLSVTITTTGRPVALSLQTDGTTSQSIIGSSVGSTFEPGAEFQFVRGSTALGTYYIDALHATSGVLFSFVPSSCLRILDTPAAGTYTYKVQIRVTNAAGSRTAYVNYSTLVAYEI